MTERDPRLLLMEALRRKRGGGCWRVTWGPGPYGGVMAACIQRRGHEGSCRNLMGYEWEPDDD